MLGCNISDQADRRILSFPSYQDLFAKPAGGDLAGTKKKHIFLYKDDFQMYNVNYKNHMQGVYGAVYQLFAQTECLLWICQLYGEYDRFYLAGFLQLWGKHNRDNGEENRDGNNFNCSFNYGAEGATKNKQIQKMRFQQVKNGLCMTFFITGSTASGGRG